MTWKQSSRAPRGGDSTLDIMYTNAPTQIADLSVLPPLCSTGGVDSNHKCVYATLNSEPARNFVWEVRYTRKRSRRADGEFCRELGNADWSGVELAVGVHAKTDELEKVIGSLMEKHYPLIRSRRRSNEPPWITHRIRGLYRKKCRIYKKAGRTDEWWRTDDLMQREIADSRQEFVEKILRVGNGGRSFYAATKALSKTGTSSKQWSVRDIFSGETPSIICDRVGAEHLLVDLWDAIASALEGGQQAGVLLGVDFEKHSTEWTTGSAWNNLQRSARRREASALSMPSWKIEQ